MEHEPIPNQKDLTRGEEALGVERQAALSRRAFMRLTGVAMGAVAIAACVAPAPEQATDSAAPISQAEVSLNLLTYSLFVPRMNELFQEFANNWAAQNGVSLELEYVSTSDIAARVAAAIETGSGPNLTQFNAPPANIIAGLVDITDVAEDIGDQQDGWYPAAQAVSRFDGRWYAIPVGSHTMMVNYRVDWFSEIGYDSFPDNWDDMLEAGRRLKAAGRPYGWVFSGGQAPFDGLGHALVMLWSFGAKEFDDEGNLVLDSPETLEALEYGITLYNETCDPGSNAYNDATNNQAFLASQISMTMNVNTIYLPAVADNPELAEAMDHALPPEGPGGRFSYQGFPFFGILNHTTGETLEASKGFLRDFYEVSHFGDWIKLGRGYLIPQAPIYEELPIWDPDPKLELAREVGRLGRWAGYSLPSPTPLSSLMASQFTVGNMFTNAVTNGDARAALDDTLAEIEGLRLQAES
jgi:multiple sugar transport system substrate-binding protein